jgi:hypothetical protein
VTTYVRAPTTAPDTAACWPGRLAVTDCTTEPVAVGETTTLSCTSADQIPRSYDRITINDSF